MLKRKDFEFKKGNTYKMNFDSFLLSGSIISLAAVSQKDRNSLIEAVISAELDVISAVLPSNLNRGDYEYDLEINRNGVITTEYIGRITIT